MVGPKMRGLLAGIAMAGLLAACSGGLTASIDEDQLQGEIETQLGEQIGVPLQSVECPDGRAFLAGDVFTCTASTERGGPIEIEVTQNDAQGDVDFRVLSLVTERVEDVLMGDLPDLTGTGITGVQCPESRPFQAGDVFECTAAADDGSQLTVEVTQSDAEGNITYRVAGS
ncbi:MAG: DUF4333 domain-containing protein [Chloroflexi bacterium]|nr:DUF4333 domain-containing protein [Chloroflexota bacterium]